MHKILLALFTFFFIVPLVTSANITFEDDTENPVFRYSAQTSTFDQMRVYSHDIVNIGDEYKMFYTGVGNGNSTQIGLAVSNDGVNWVRSSSNPIFRCGNNLQSSCVQSSLWSSYRVGVVSVIFEEEEYKMWFFGNNENLGPNYEMGLATSSDGVNWSVVQEEPVFDPGIGNVTYISVEKFEGEYRLYYTDRINQGLYLTKSNDGVTWSTPSKLQNGLVHSIGLLEDTFVAVSETAVATSADGMSFDFESSLVNIENNASVDQARVVFLFEGEKVVSWRVHNLGNVIWNFGNFGIYRSVLGKNDLLGLEGKNSYPLYTQIKSPYPSLDETEEWADDKMPCGTIAICGCTISSLVSAADYFGFEEDVLGQSPTPATMNSYLKTVGGYNSVGVLSWLAASAYFGEFTPEGKLATRLQYPPRFIRDDVKDEMRSELEDGALVLGFKELNALNGDGHFVWLPAVEGESFVVRDPRWYETKIASTTVTDSNIQKNYKNEFDEARAYTVLDESETFSGSAIEVFVRGTAEILFENALGDRVGFADGSVLLDLERAAYGSTSIVSLDGTRTALEGGKSLLVNEAGKEFTLTVVGTEVGEFSLDFFTMDEFGGITSYQFSGLTFPGLETVFTFNLESGTVTESEISYEDFLVILDTLLGDVTPQQRTFFERRAEKVFATIEEKTTSQAVQSLEVFEKLLVAKKVDSPTFFTVLDTLRAQVE